MTYEPSEATIEAAWDALLGDNKNAMRAALIAAREVDGAGWQPIDAKTPTNTSILVFIPGCEHYGPGIYRASLCDIGTGKHWHTTALHCESNAPAHLQPTHWRPLPASPATEGDK